MSATPFLSDGSVTHADACAHVKSAFDTNATNRPSALMAGDMLWPAGRSPSARHVQPRTAAPREPNQVDADRVADGVACLDEIGRRRFEDHGRAVGADGGVLARPVRGLSIRIRCQSSGRTVLAGPAERHGRRRAATACRQIARCGLEDHISSVVADVRAGTVAVAGRSVRPDALEGDSPGREIQHVDILELITVGLDESRQGSEDDVTPAAAHAG